MLAFRQQVERFAATIPEPLAATMTSLALQRRKSILSQLGLDALVSRSSWSHDLGDAIVFDAWEHHWERDDRDKLLCYPLRTSGPYYNLAESRRKLQRGHIRWQNHVDLVLAGKRKARAIVPVAIDPTAKSNKGAKGWLPLVVECHVEIDEGGDVWLRADQVVQLSSR